MTSKKCKTKHCAKVSHLRCPVGSTSALLLGPFSFYILKKGSDRQCVSYKPGTLPLLICPSSPHHYKSSACFTKLSQSLKVMLRANLVGQWLRTCFARQETPVWSLIWEDPTCLKASKPVRRNCWVHTLEPICCNYWSPHTYSPCFTTREATTMKSSCTSTNSPHSLQLEKALLQQLRHTTAKK